MSRSAEEGHSARVRGAVSRGRGWAHVLTLIFLFPFSACSGPPEDNASPEAPSEEDLVRQEFVQICANLRASEERFYGEKPHQTLEARLESGLLDAEETLVAHSLLGTELLESGRVMEAIGELETAYRSAQELGVDATFRQEILGRLAVAHLQAAEDANCMGNASAASCILPISEGSIHRAPEMGRKAGDLYLQFLEEVPRSSVAAWLLNVSRMVTGDFPRGVPEPLRVSLGESPDAERPLWRDRGRELGINVVDLAGGAVLDDFDGDGWLDLITSTTDPCGSLKAFRNDGRGGFENVTEDWHLDGQWGGLNLIHGDYDGDGALDLLVLRGAWMFEYGRIRNSLLHNETAGGGGFRDVTRAAGLGGEAEPTQTAAWADYDGDGDLDLYIGNEAQPPRMAPSRLYRNDGEGGFEDVTRAAGVANRRFAKGVTWGDYDDDGDPDLYVSNIGPNRLYRNDGDGTFTDVAPELGVTGPEGKSFTSWFFDFDNDGDLDLFVADYNGPLDRVVGPYFGRAAEAGHPWLYRNDGGRFTEVSRRLGMTRPLLPMGANFGDLDNDGWLDIYLGTGDPELESQIPNAVLHNRSGGGFVDITFDQGLGHLQKGHGVAFGDVDNDGDQDLFHQLGGFFPGDAFGNALFENPGSAGRWITLRLRGTKANLFGVGARIAVTVEGPHGRRTVHALGGSGGSFGGSSLQQEIGLGDAEAIDEILIRWPGSATVDRISGPSLDRFYEVIEGSGEARELLMPQIELGVG